MKIQQQILYILGEHGSIPIPMLCQELTKTNRNIENIDKVVHPAAIKSVIKQNSDLFLLRNGLVTIHPDKQILGLVADVGDNLGSWYKINVDFLRKDYTYFEWCLKNSCNLNPNLSQGDNSFSKLRWEVFQTRIWDWDEAYEEEGIIVDGISWSVKLITIGKTYESKGMVAFPTKWNKLCLAIQNFTGKSFG